MARPEGALMKNAKGQEVRWVIAEDLLAWAKETQTPEKYAEIKANYKRFCDEHKPKPPEIQIIQDSQGRVVAMAALTHRVVPVFSAEEFTDPWTGRPRVFTQEEKKKYGIK